MKLIHLATITAVAAYAFVAQSARAQVTEFTSFTEWQSAAGSYTTIDFTGLPDGTFITSQYAPQGVLFTDGDDNTNFGPTSFPLDQWGLDGNAAIHLSFSSPQSWIGVHYPGAIQFQLLGADQAIDTSSVITPGGGAISGFAGLVSSQPFDSAILISANGPEVHIDNLYFAVPGPGALTVMAVAGLWLARRRRRASFDDSDLLQHWLARFRASNSQAGFPDRGC